MRKLTDHFCTFRQGVKLINLGFDISNQLHIKHENLRTVILRSQALDFFRGKGWQFAIKCLNKMYWYEIYIGDSISFDENITEDGLYDYHVSESALIDKLIELLESEAQNGN